VKRGFPALKVLCLVQRATGKARDFIHMQAVPDTEGEVLSRLKELESELEPLAHQKRKIEMRTFR